MLEHYKAGYTDGTGEIIEKKSRFIASVKPINTQEEANEFLEATKKKYWDARHNCYAYTIGTKIPILRCSDDGEPSNTAGKPILEVILGEEIHNIMIIVTRYFGGTLLGTGGLVRAYTKAAQEGLKNTVVIDKHLAVKVSLTTNYTDAGKLQYILSTNEIHTTGTNYSDVVTIDILVPVGSKGILYKQLIEATGNRVLLEEMEQVYFALLEGECLIFEGDELEKNQ